MFYNVFKSITVDNGAEFADYEGMEKSCCREEKMTTIYYCHPYSSYESGSNENQSKMIRRHIPKGTDFDDKTDEDSEQIEGWINEYPPSDVGLYQGGTLPLFRPHHGCPFQGCLLQAAPQAYQRCPCQSSLRI